MRWLKSESPVPPSQIIDAFKVTSDMMRELVEASKTSARIDAFHGSTHDFEAFSLDHASESSWYGKALFFTNDYAEAKSYANPDNDDLGGRLELRRDALIKEWYDEDDLHNMKHEGDNGGYSAELLEAMDEALAQAERELVGNQPSIKRVRIEFDNPVKVSRGGTMFTADETFKQALESVATKHQVKRVEQVYDTLINSVIQKTKFSALEFEEAAKRLEIWNFNIGKPGQFVADMYRALGFDGIIMTPSTVFRGRKLRFNPGTKHYVVFDPSQIHVEGTDPVKLAGWERRRAH